MPSDKKLFLFDSNQYAEEKDCFGIHTDIANTILNCIEKTRFTKSAFTLGLFGNWGSGKSFIINQVVNKLDKTQYQCLYIDVWKYIGHPLSRSILFDIEKQLVDAKVVGFVDGYKNSKEQKLEQILYSNEKITDQITLTTAEICKRIGGFIKIAGIAWFVAFLIAFISHICIDLYSNLVWLSNLSIKAVYKVNLKSEELKGSVLKQQYDIIVGVVSKQGDEIIKKDGLAQTVTIMVPNENNKSIIENELLKYIYPLIQQVAVRF